MLTSRDIGSKFHPAVSGVALKFDQHLLSFFTGGRANGVGYFKDGQIEFGLGRNVYNDDQKGLPDGTQDSELYELSFSFGLFPLSEVNSLHYRSHFDVYDSPILRVDSHLPFGLDQKSLSFAKTE